MDYTDFVVVAYIMVSLYVQCKSGRSVGGGVYKMSLRVHNSQYAAVNDVLKEETFVPSAREHLYKETYNFD